MSDWAMKTHQLLLPLQQRASEAKMQASLATGNMAARGLSQMAAQHMKHEQFKLQATRYEALQKLSRSRIDNERSMNQAKIEEIQMRKMLHEDKMYSSQAGRLRKEDDGTFSMLQRRKDGKRGLEYGALDDVDSWESAAQRRRQIMPPKSHYNEGFRGTEEGRRQYDETMKYRREQEGRRKEFGDRGLDLKKDANELKGDTIKIMRDRLTHDKDMDVKQRDLLDGKLEQVQKELDKIEFDKSIKSLDMEFKAAKYYNEQMEEILKPVGGFEAWEVIMGRAKAGEELLEGQKPKQELIDDVKRKIDQLNMERAAQLKMLRK